MKYTEKKRLTLVKILIVLIAVCATIIAVCDFTPTPVIQEKVIPFTRS